MTHPTYNTQGFRQIGEPGQAHARTEYRTATGRTISIKGTGPEVRDILVKHAEGRNAA